MFQRIGAILLGVVIVAALGIGCGGNDDPRWEGETVKLGSIFSTSGAGIAYGPQQLRGAELAVEHVNEDGGISGATLSLEQSDDGSDPQETGKVITDLIEGDAVVAVLGPTFSNSAAVAHPIANQLGTPVVAVSNTGPGIVGNCGYDCDLIFRNSLGEEAAIPANIASLLAGDDFETEAAETTAAIVHPDDDPFGASSAEIAVNAFETEGVADANVFSGPRALAHALDGDPDVLMITASSGETAIELAGEARNRGFSGPILGGNAFNSSLAAEQAGAGGAGARSAAAWFHGNPSSVNAEFIEDYVDAYGEQPDQFAAQAYSGVMLLAKAAEQADLTFDDLAADRQALAEALAKVESETPLGHFNFTPDHDVSQPIWIVAMDGSGSYELIEEIPAD